MGYLPMWYFPPPGYGPGFPPPGGGGVPPYPGPPGVNMDPRFQFNPSFDGLFSHGLTTSPYLNSQMEDINMLQYQIYGASGVGYAPPFGMMPPPGYMPPPFIPPPVRPTGKGKDEDPSKH